MSDAPMKGALILGKRLYRYGPVCFAPVTSRIPQLTHSKRPPF